MKDMMDLLCDGAKQCFQAFLTCDLDKVAQYVNKYGELKMRMFPKFEPEFVTRLRTELHRGPDPVLCCSSLAGAGGGGYLYGLLAKGVTRDRLESAVNRARDAVDGCAEALIMDIKLDYEGIKYF